MAEHRTIAIQVGPRASVGRGRVALSPQKVEAEVLGRWAVHPTWDSAVGGEDFTVTHVKAGLAIADRMTKKQAVELARNLTISLDVEDIERDRHREIAEREVRAVGGRFLRTSEGIGRAAG